VKALASQVFIIIEVGLYSLFYKSVGILGMTGRRKN